MANDKRTHVTRHGPGEVAVSRWINTKASDLVNMSTKNIRSAAAAGNPFARKLVNAARKAGRRLSEFKRTYGEGQPGTKAYPKLGQVVEDVTPVVRKLGRGAADLTGRVGRSIGEDVRGVGRGIGRLIEGGRRGAVIGAPVGRPYDPNRVIGAAKGGVVKSSRKKSKKSKIDGIARKGHTRAPHK